MRDKLLLFSLFIIITCSGSLAQDKALLEKGQGYLNQGSYEMARKTLEQAVDVKTSSQGVESLIELYCLTGEYEKALALAKDLSKHKEAAARGLMWAGEVLMQVGRYDEALESFQAARISNPQSIRVTTDLGMCYQALGQKERYIRLYSSVFDNYDPDYEYTAEDLTYIAISCRYYAMNSDEVDRSDTLKTIVQQVLPDATAMDKHFFMARIQMAEIFIEAFNTVDAKSTIDEALALNPHHPGVLLCQMKMQLQKYELLPQVIPTADHILNINKNMVDALVVRAAVRFSDEEYKQGHEDLQRALQINPNHLEARSVLAGYYYVQKQQSAYERECAKVLAINPIYGSLYYTIAQIAVSKRKFEDSVKLNRKAIELDPFLWNAYIDLGMNLMRVGEEEEAQKHFQKIREEYNFHVQTHNMLLLLNKYKEFKTFFTPHFKIRLHVMDADLLYPILKVYLEEMFTELSNLYQFTPEFPIVFEMFPNHNDFAVRTIGLGGLGASGACFGKVVVQDSPRAMPPGAFNWGSVAWHEFTHVVTLQLSDYQVPRWFTEGLSELSERDRDASCLRNLDMQLYSAYTAGKMRGIRDLNAGFTRPKYNMEVVVCYYQAGLTCYFIREKMGGFAKIVEMLKAYREGKTDEEVLKEVLQITPEEFDKRFLAWLEENVFGKMNVLPTISEEQLDELKDRIEEDPDDIDAYVKLSVGYLQRNRLRDAEINAGYLLALDPGNFRGYEILGRVDHQKKNDKRAKKYLHQAIKLGSKDFHTHLVLGVIYYSEKDFAKAIKYLQLAKSLFPRYIEASNPYLLLENLYKQQGKDDLALKELEQYLALDGNDYKRRIEVAEHYVKIKKYREALKLLQQALFIYPINVKLHMLRGEAQTAIGKWNDAIESYQAALVLKPKKIIHEVHTKLAEIYAGQRDKEKARFHANEALKAKPGYDPAQKVLDSLE